MEEQMKESSQADSTLKKPVKRPRPKSELSFKPEPQVEEAPAPAVEEVKEAPAPVAEEVTTKPEPAPRPVVKKAPAPKPVAKKKSAPVSNARKRAARPMPQVQQQAVRNPKIRSRG